jgi:hypothetical protein
MNKRATNLECSLDCPWKGSCQCLRLLVQQSVILGGHLGSAQLSGVQAMYYPHELPPCVKPDGCLHWDSLEDDPEPVLLLLGDDCPEL